MKRDDSLKNGEKFSRRWLITIILGTLAVTALGLFLLSSYRAPQIEAVSLPDIANAIDDNQVKSISLRGDLITVTQFDGSRLSARKESNVSFFESMQLLGISPATLKTLPIVVEDLQGGISNYLGLGLTLAPLMLIGFFIFMAFRHVQRGGMAGGFPNQIGQSNARVVSDTAEADNATDRPKVTFDDVAGAGQAKFELQEVVEFLKEPEKFTKLGARVPKGVLMAGPPGTGKTLMARAVAGEAGVPFLHISGSEFVEMFVGVGASRVRDLFKKAKDQAPSVVFIDEIDAVGRRRGVGLGGGNDEREQTLNQILVTMDGFDTSTNVIVIAATNRPDILDPALLRPGRFDRKVVLDLPDVEAREAILRVHTRGKPLEADISLSDLAKLTPGFAGADLENLANEAAILAARRNLSTIGEPEFQDSIERIIAGPERKGNLLTATERRTVAYHEAGHAVVMHFAEETDPVHKVSIVSRGMALGYTMPLPENNRQLRSKEAFVSEIVGLLGGRAAEEIVFNRITTGAANDLERATRLARAMVTRFGFSEKLGMRTFGEEQGNPFLGSLGETRDYSEERAQAIDQEIDQIIQAAYQQAKDLLIEYRTKLDALAETLLEQETVNRPQFEALMA
ncbi:MAG: ATP-dependent zinc metalloprotease FtsH [Anaerolineae bacterium]|nr:ATP-dependent zinc metalloprotease FtsH [Anaerolineae bacterium]